MHLILQIAVNYGLVWASRTNTGTAINSHQQAFNIFYIIYVCIYILLHPLHIYWQHETHI